MAHSTCALILAASQTSYNFSDPQKRRHFTYLNSGISLAAELISNFYVNHNIRTYLATDIDVLPKLEAFNKINLLSVESMSSITETIAVSLRALYEFDEIIINPIQSIPTKKTFASNIVLSDKEYPKENWTSVVFESNKAARFLFKNHDASYGKKSNAFTGRLHCYRKDLVELVYSTLPGELNDLGYLAHKLFTQKNYQLVFDKWFDLSHADLKLESKMNSISSRSFHSLSYKSKNKIITKKMDSTTSVHRISSYYDLLTKEASLYFPQLISTNNERESSIYCSFEFIPHPTLSELYLHEELGIISWSNIAEQLKDVNDCISRVPIASMNTKSRKFCTEKLQNRQAQLEKIILKNDILALRSIYFEPFAVNGIQYPSLQNTFEILQSYLQEIEEVGLDFLFSHGDLCFNNILADPLSGIVKVIDPRISSDSNLPIGSLPYLYDLAKLNHSVTYLYDSIVNNLYQIHFDSSVCFNLKVFAPRRYNMIRAVFQDAFGGIIFSPNVNLITASLFLSMLPLHSESPNRVMALAAMGSAIVSNPGESKLNFSFL